jgi:hypothetical protein
MGFLRRRRPEQRGIAAQIPLDFARTLELYGRWESDPPGSGIDPSQIGQGNFQYEMWLLAQADKTAFLEAVAQVAISAGGWAVYGGERLIMNQVGSYPELRHPDYLAVLDAATNFIEAYGPGYLPPYYLERRSDRVHSQP